MKSKLRVIVRFECMESEQNGGEQEGRFLEQALRYLGNQLKLARKRAGMSQKVVATELGVSYQSVWAWESGRHEPSREKLGKLTRLYGLPPGDFNVPLGMRIQSGQMIPLDSSDRIPVRGLIKAGSDLVEEPVLNSSDLMRAAFPNVFEMAVSGPDLEDEGISDGDHVSIDPDANVAIGKLFAIEIDEEVRIRKLAVDDDGEVVIAPDATTSRNLKLGSPNVKIVGRVVGRFHLY